MNSFKLCYFHRLLLFLKVFSRTYHPFLAYCFNPSPFSTSYFTLSSFKYYNRLQNDCLSNQMWRLTTILRGIQNYMCLNPSLESGLSEWFIFRSYKSLSQEKPPETLTLSHLLRELQISIELQYSVCYRLNAGSIVEFTPVKCQQSLPRFV